MEEALSFHGGKNYLILRDDMIFHIFRKSLKTTKCVNPPMLVSGV